MTAHSKKRQRENRQAIVILFVVLAFLLTIGGIALWIKPSLTGCPDDGKYPRTVVLIDATDSFSPSQVKTVREHINELRRELTLHEWVGIFVLRADNLILPEPEIALCNPGSEADANPLYQNPEIIRRRFERKFQRPLEDALRRLAETESPQATSPILEMVEAIALDSDFDSTQMRRMIIISDMLQNVPQYSHYRDSPPNFSTFRESGYARQFMNLSLLGVDVEILYLIRESTGELQTHGHIAFWKNYFDAVGGKLNRVKPVR